MKKWLWLFGSSLAIIGALIAFGAIWLPGFAISLIGDALVSRGISCEPLEATFGYPEVALGPMTCGSRGVIVVLREPTQVQLRGLQPYAASIDHASLSLPSVVEAEWVSEIPELRGIRHSVEAVLLSGHALLADLPRLEVQELDLTVSGTTIASASDARWDPDSLHLTVANARFARGPSVSGLTLEREEESLTLSGTASVNVRVILVDVGMDVPFQLRVDSVTSERPRFQASLSR